MNAINSSFITAQPGIYASGTANAAAPTAKAEVAEPAADSFSSTGTCEAGQDVKKMMLSTVSGPEQTEKILTTVPEDIAANTASTAADVTASLTPSPASGLLAGLKDKISSAIHNIGEMISPPEIVPDKETKDLTRSFGALTAITGSLPEEEKEQLLMESGKRNLDDTLESMQSLRYLQRPALRNSGMTLAQKTALFAYTGDAYAEINTALRKHDTEKVEMLRPLIDRTVEALDTLPSYSGKVYRGAEMPQAFFDEHKPGAKVTYDAFTSTSTKSLLSFKGNTEIMIDALPEDSAGKDIQKFSKFPHEKEILFPPGTDFIVLSHTEKDGRHFIHLKELPRQQA